MGTPSFSFVTRMFYFLNQHKIPPDIRTHKFKLKNPSKNGVRARGVGKPRSSLAHDPSLDTTGPRIYTALSSGVSDQDIAVLCIF